MVEFSFSNVPPYDDYAFLYGFSLFETFLVSNSGNVFLIDHHINRLFKSIEFFELECTFNKNDLLSSILRYIQEENIKNKILRLSVTFGNPTKNITSKAVLSIRDYNASPEHYNIIVSDIPRNEKSFIVHHKTSNYLENFLQAKEAAKKGYDDILFLNTAHQVCETSKCNIFMVSDNTLYTPKIECGILPGIIRNWVIRNIETFGYKLFEGSFDIDFLLSCSEAFMTNSVIGIIPIKSINYKNNLINYDYPVNCINIIKTLATKLSSAGF